MKLAIFALLLISLSACENCATVNSTGKKEETTGNSGGVSEKAAAILDVKDELINSLKIHFNVKNMTNITNELQTLENATDDTQKAAALKALVDAKGSYSFTPLHLAKDAKTAKALIKAGADVNAKDDNERTPLHLVNNAKTAKALIKARADVNAKDNLGSTPLFYIAATIGDKDTVQVLLDAGSDKNIKNNEGKTPAQVATEAGRTEIADLINSYGNTNPNPAPATGSAPTPTAAPQAVSEKVDAILAVKDDLIKLLTPTSLNLNSAFNLDSMLKNLQDATDDKQKEAALKALVSAKNSFKNTPLHNAAFAGNKEIVEVLLNAGADVNFKNLYGLTPLHDNISNGNKEILEALLNAGADLNADKYDSNKSPLYWAILHGNEHTVNALIKAGAELPEDIKERTTFLYNAIKKNKLNLVKILIDKGTINTKNSNGDTPLLVAVNEGNKDIVEFLLNAGADKNIKNNIGKTPYQIAVYENHEEIAVLISKYK